MRATLKFIPLILLFAFLITCNNIQANLNENNNFPNQHEMNILVVPNEVRINEEVIVTVDLLLEDEKFVELIELELWRTDDKTTDHQRIEVTKKKGGKYYYKTYFDYPGTYQMNVHVLVNGVRKMTSKTFTVSL